MEYCCDDFEDMMYDRIEVGTYPSGREYYLEYKNYQKDVRIYYCPFCGVNLEEVSK